MATIKVSKKIPPVTINKFLGLNENLDGQFGLKLGEASNMLNFRVTSGYQLKKREGYKQLFSLTGTIRGMWYGKLNGNNIFLICAGGHLYKGDLTAFTTTDIGTLTDAPTRFIPFGNKVYLNNGSEYKSYDGTTFQTVEGYRPKIFIGTPPSGGGTAFEQINVLTGAKHQTFSATESDTVYVLAEKGLTSIDFVKVSGTLKTLNTDYTIDLANGKVTFTTAPAKGEDNVDIGWTKGTGQRDLIEKCRFSMDFSGASNSRIFLWGNMDHKNRRFWSGLADGVPSAEYFEANSYSDVGNGQYAITDIVKMGDTQKIFLENSTMYSIYATTTVQNQTLVTFPIYELSDEIGNVAYGQVQAINNELLSIYKGIYSWSNTNVQYQTNHSLVSEKVQDSLDLVDLSTAVTFNYQERKECWLNVGGIVWIFNYLNGAWYKFDNISASQFIVINGELYFSSGNTIQKFDVAERTDNNTAINAVWEMGFYDFEAEYLTKFMNNMWVSINPATKTSIDVQVVTNNEGTSEKQTVYYSLSTFLHANFEHWSFATSYNPQPKYLEIQAYGFVYLKLVLTNNSTTDLVTILSINLPARQGGKVR